MEVMHVKYWNNLIGTGLFVGFMLSNCVADAALVTNRVPMLTYAETTVPTFKEPNGKRFASFPGIKYLKRRHDQG